MASTPARGASHRRLSLRERTVLSRSERRRSLFTTAGSPRRPICRFVQRPIGISKSPQRRLEPRCVLVTNRLLHCGELFAGCLHAGTQLLRRSWLVALSQGRDRGRCFGQVGQRLGGCAPRGFASRSSPSSPAPARWRRPRLRRGRPDRRHMAAPSRRSPASPDRTKSSSAAAVSKTTTISPTAAVPSADSRMSDLFSLRTRHSKRPQAASRQEHPQRRVPASARR